MQISILVVQKLIAHATTLSSDYSSWMVVVDPLL